MKIPRTPEEKQAQRLKARSREINELRHGLSDHRKRQINSIKARNAQRDMHTNKREIAKETSTDWDHVSDFHFQDPPNPFEAARVYPFFDPGYSMTNPSPTGRVVVASR